jgi:hypothetical protein
VWAAEWLKTISKTPSIATDEGTMIGWFANAIMAGYDEAERRHQPLPLPDERELCKQMARAYFDSEQREAEIWGRCEAAMRDVLAILRPYMRREQEA